MEKSLNRNNFYTGIQALRAICCIGIVIAHSCAYAEWEYDISIIYFYGRHGMLNLVTLFL